MEKTVTTANKEKAQEILKILRARIPLREEDFAASRVAKESSDQTRLSLRLVDAVGYFARGRYVDAADTLKLVPADQRIGVGGSYVERALIDLLEVRAVELAG